MSEMEPYYEHLGPMYVEVAGEKIELSPDNHSIAMFRDEPDRDYLDLYKHDEDGVESHIWVFGRREMCIWMGRVALSHEDQQILRRSERTYGPFRSRTGFNSKTFIEDKTTEWEAELYTEYLLKDLEKVTGPGDIPA